MTFCIVNITVSLTCRTRILQRKFSHHHIQVWTGSHADGRVAKEISGNSGVGEGENQCAERFPHTDEKVAVFRALFLAKTPRMHKR